MHRIAIVVFSLLFSLSWLPVAQPVAFAQSDQQSTDAPAPSPSSEDTPITTLFLPLVVQQQPSDSTLVEAKPPAQTDYNEIGHNDYYLAEQARLRNEPPFVAPAVDAAALDNVSQLGQWGSVVTWPFVFATAANLPDGRIIAWGGNNPTSFSGGTSTYASIWDPATNQFLSRNHTNHSMFCAIPTMMEDGRVFVNGGDGTRERTSTFDYRTDAWTRIQNMNVGRWYNGAVALANGQVFTALGDPGSRYPELWTANVGWAYLNGADLQAPILNFAGYQNNWLPYLFLNSDGRLFHTGPTQQMNWITPTGNGSVAASGLNNTWYPKYSSSIMYDEGKILVAGGQINGSNLAATNQAMIIDLTGPTPTKTTISPMANARKFNNGILLPTGEVLVIGGNTSGTEFSDSGTILTPEIWNPTTQAWRAVAPHSVPRNYHSVALLMTDGRVFSGGGGLCACSADHPDHQIYSPPYLFNADGTAATRPTITDAPNVVSFGRTISVQATPGMAKFSLIKMSGTTHNLNSDLRYLNVPFTEASSGQYQLTLHSNRNVMTPGYWMLFAVNGQGVPSVSKVIQVSSSDAPVVTNPGAQSSTQGSAVNLPIVATDPTGDPLTYSATGLPTGLTINSTTGVINGIVTTLGVYNVTVTVNDGLNHVDVTFTWSVSPPGSIRFVKLEALSEVNGNPWTSMAEFNLVDGNNVLLNRTGWSVTPDSEEIQGEDGRAINVVDGNSVSIWHTQWQTSNPPHPHWLVVDMGVGATIGGFRYLPRQDVANGRIANYRFYVSADGINWGAPVAQGAFTDDAAEKSVSVPQTQPPTVTTPPDQTSRVGDTVSLQISASDPDGDPLTYTAADLPPGLTINNAGLIAGAATTLGSYNVTVTVRDDRGLATTISFSWTVQPPTFTINPLSSPPQPVNIPINYVASVTNAVNPRFKWLFGDGAPETAYSTDPIISHSFAQPGIYVLRLTVIDDSNTEKSITFNQAVHLALTANRPATSMNIVYEQRSTGNSRIWAVNPDNDTVSVFDAVTNDKLAEIAVGLMPRSLAVAPNGHVWVTNKGAATLSLINVNTLNVAQTVNLPYGSQPFGVVFAPDGSAAYITLEASGQVLKLNVNDGALLGSVNVGPNPRHLAVSADGGALLVARFITPRLPGEETASVQTEVGGVQVGGEVVVVNTAAMSVAQTIVLQHSNKNDTEVQGRGFPNYLAVPAISPDGTSAWVPSKQDNLRRGALRDGNNLNFQNTVRAISSRIDLASGVEDLNSRIDHDNAGVASAGLFDHFGVYLFVALETSREVAVVDVHGHRELFRINVGRAPQGLALSPDGLRLYVHNFMDRTISVLDITNLINQGDQNAPTLATLQAVASESLTPQVLLGKQLFYDAKDPRLALDSYISCAACHNDGAHDGRVWDITGMGEGLRNTINLRGRGGMGQGFLHWSGNFDEVQDFEGQIRALSGGTGLLSASDFAATQDPLGAAKTGLSADLDALAAYVASLNSFAVSPKRNADGSLTVDAQAGKTIFTNANCAQCHGGAGFTLSGAANLQNIGTIRPSSGSRLGGPLTGIDTPTLRDVWATAPYLHDGSAATLANAVSAHSGVSLGATDLVQLVAYLEQIDANEQAPVNPPPTVNLTSPTNGASFNSGSTISLAADASDANGTVTQVEFYDGATLLNIDTSSPYSFDWAGGGIGSHSLTAKAYDNLGASTTSAAVNITVNAVGNGLLGSYFANVSLSGSPVLQRVEVVNFNWGSAAPAANVPADNFSVRWTGRVLAPTTGTYYFRTVSDDGVRLWVNGTRRINNWNNHSSTTNTSKAVTLTGGQYYTIKLEYYENTGSAVIQLLWRTPGTSTYVVIPQSQLAPQ